MWAGSRDLVTGETEAAEGQRGESQASPTLLPRGPPTCSRKTGHSSHLSEKHPRALGREAGVHPVHLSQLSGCEVGYHSPGRSQDRDVSGGRWTCALPLVNLTIQAASIKGWRRGHHWGGERVLKVWVESNFLPGCSSIKQDIRKRGLPAALSS